MLVLALSNEEDPYRCPHECHLADKCAENLTGCLAFVAKNRSTPQYEEMQAKTLLESKSPLLQDVQELVAGSDDYSPRGVLEQTDDGSDSNGCSPSCFSGSASQVEHIPSPNGPHESNIPDFKSSCLSLWRNVSMRRQNTFPSSGQTKTWNSSPSFSSSRTNVDPRVSSGRLACSNPETPLNAALPERLPWKCFTYEEMSTATHGFDPGNLVGKGGYAEVYKGILANGQVVAVKKLTRGNTDDQREMAFLQELGIIAHVRHPNTASLIGFCLEQGLYLVLHFLPHGSLASLLHGSNFHQFPWDRRFIVALGTARGLSYLHNCSQRRTIHRDIKASNILLGPDFGPQISDFGLAKWLPEKCTHLTVLPIEGTFGYLAPEYFMHGIVHEKTDVFAFGVLLLELISGHQPIDSYKQNIIVWAKPYLESGNIEELVDPRLCGEYDAKEIRRAAITAYLCVQHSSSVRPCMEKVMEMLLDAELDIESPEKWSKLVQMIKDSNHSEQLEDEYNSKDYENDISQHRALVPEFRFF